MVPETTNTWHTMEAREVAEALGVSPATGLSATSAGERLERYGPNELGSSATRSLPSMVIGQFNDVTIWILLVATVISLLVGDRTDAIVILAIVALNAVMGVVQEHRAEKSLEALKQMSAPTARVLRDGAAVDVPSREVVPGDVLLLEAGNVVSADARVVSGASLLSDEAILTGESDPVEKTPDTVSALDAPTGDRYGILFAGTSVVGGRGSAVVVATGAATEVGRIAALLSDEKADQTPLQRKLAVMGKWIAAGVIAICVVVFVAGLLRGEPAADMFLTSVSLAVAAIPEGLPAVVTIVLAVGMGNMARRNALIRRLQAVETLGATTVICTDKTGTLTQNQMTVRQWWMLSGFGDIEGVGYAPQGLIRERGNAVSVSDRADIRWLLKSAVLCNDAELAQLDGVWAVHGDPTEGALLTVAGKAGITRDDMARKWPRVAEAPFDSTRKRMTTVHSSGGETIIVVKGASDGLRPLCTHVLVGEAEEPITDGHLGRIQDAGVEMAATGLRVLGFAFRRLPPGNVPNNPVDLERDLTFIGLLGMMDPPRPEAGDAIAACQTAGIRPVMITGDHPITAAAIAREIGLTGGGVMSGRELAAASETQLAEAVRSTSVFARVSPEDKLRLVGALKKAGEIVAMTGDGVNDAPALKRADIGVAMGQSGTDVAKGASDMVLTDDNFASIVAAVEEGRTVFANIRKAVFYLLSCNTSEVLVLFVAILMGWHPPLLAVQILWVNLVTDGLPALALGVDPGERDAMKRPPRDPAEGVLTRRGVVDIVLYGVFITIAVLAAFVYSGGHHAGKESLMYAQTAAFLTLSCAQLVHSFNCRSFFDSLFHIGPLSNPQLIGAAAISALVQISAVYLPWGHHMFRTVSLTGPDLALVLAMSLSPLLVGEILKAIRRYRASAQ